MTMLILAICVRMCQINIYWGLGAGGWERIILILMSNTQSPIPNIQSPIPNPQYLVWKLD